MPKAPRPVASGRRVALTILGTALVVVLEFALLMGVYQRVAPLHRQQRAVAQLQGEVRDAAAEAPSPARRARISHDVDAALGTLTRAGLSRSDGAAVRVANTQLSGSAPGAGLSTLRSSVDRLADSLRARQHALDVQAGFSYAGLLVIASFGWMIWFRRLVTRHRALQSELTSQQTRVAGELRLAALVRNATDVVLVCDLDATITFATPSLAGVLGADPEQVSGTSVTDLLEPADREVFLQLIATIGDGDDSPVVARMRHLDGRTLNVEGTVSNLLAEPAVAGLVLTFRDVTARVELEEQLTHQAFHDPLTGLANRQLFSDRLFHALERRGETARPLVVMFCDLDEFKNVNDSSGHGMGDRVLVEVARRALSCVRSADTVARLGGDEFAVLLEDHDLPAAEVTAHRLLAAISRPMAVDGAEFTVRASIGLALAMPGEMSGDEALRNADVAMYLAKDRGKGTVATYEASLHAEALQKLELRGELQRAIRGGELVLHYQPTVDLATSRVAGFEALVRWSHPTRGLLPPNEFIPVAEDTGLIHELGRRVLRQACRAAAELFSDEPFQGRSLSMAVNVASQQLERADFVSEVLAAVHDSGLSPSQLTLEITESALLHDMHVVVERLRQLRESGIRIAIDDFGTGYSSLAYLRDLPVDSLKVDKSFIDRLTTDRNDAALAEAILTMSSTMNLSTVAEGVEDEAQAEWLTHAHCRYGQGFLWSRPVPFEEARRLLRQSVIKPQPSGEAAPPGVLPLQRDPQAPVSPAAS